MGCFYFFQSNIFFGGDFLQKLGTMNFFIKIYSLHYFHRILPFVHCCFPIFSTIFLLKTFRCFFTSHTFFGAPWLFRLPNFTLLDQLAGGVALAEVPLSPLGAWKGSWVKNWWILPSFSANKKKAVAKWWNPTDAGTFPWIFFKFCWIWNLLDIKT